VTEGLGLTRRLAESSLVDTSVWSKARANDELAEWFNGEARNDRVLVCDVVVLELLKSAGSTRAYEHQAAQLDALGSVPVEGAAFRRARGVQRLLAGDGHHRGVPPADLLIAAAAELAGVPVVHYDRDYDLIGAVTGQECRWVAPPGTLA
jgi:predicted nucleic acid-binding protein